MPNVFTTDANAVTSSFSIPSNVIIPRPYSVAIDHNDNILAVVHFDFAPGSGDELVKLDSSGKMIWSSGNYGVIGSGDGQLYNPLGIAVDGSNNIYVSEQGNSRIDKFNSAGVFQGWLGGCSSGTNCVANTHSNGFLCTDATCSAPVSGVADAQFSGNQDIVIDGSNNIYVIDNGLIKKFDSSGTFITKSVHIYNVQPHGIATSGNRVYVSTGNAGILAYDTNLVQQVGETFGSGQYNGITISNSGTTYALNGDYAIYGALAFRVDQFSGSTLTGWLGGCNSGANCDTAHGHSIGFSCTDATCNSLALLGSLHGQFDRPSDLATDSLGNIYVADTYNNRIEKYSSSGTFVASFGAPTTEDSVHAPRIIKFDSLGNAYVGATLINNQQANLVASEIVKITSGGTISSIIEGQPQRICCIYDYLSVSDFTIDHSNNLVVSDPVNDRVFKFDSNGALVSHIDSIVDPKFVAVDSSNNIYMTRGYSRVDEFNSAGVFQGWLGGCNGGANCDIAHSHSNGFLCTDATCIETEGTGDGQFGHYMGRFAFDTANNLYVIDGENERVEKFDPNGAFIGWLGGCNSGTNCDVAHSHSNGFLCTSATCSAPISGSGDGQFQFDASVEDSYLSIDSANNLYVIDEINHHIQKFDSSGTFLGRFGTYGGNSNGQFVNPSGVGFDGSGNIYVADYWLDKIQKFNSGGTFISTFGPSDHQIDVPTGVAIDASHNVYVSQSITGRNFPGISKYNSVGTFVKGIGASVQGGQPIDDLMGNTGGVITDSSGNIYAADYDHNRILKYNSAGAFQGWLGTCDSGTNCDIANGHSKGFLCTDATCNLTHAGSYGGKSLDPTGITIDNLGYIYVANTGYISSILKFSSTGNFVSGFYVLPPLGNGAFGVAVDSSGYIYVADAYSSVLKYNSAGTLQGWLGGCDSGANCDTAHGHSNGFLCTDTTCHSVYGSGDGQFDSPMGVAVDSSGNIYVADMVNNRIEVFDQSGNFLLTFGTQGVGVGEFDYPTDVRVDNGNIYVVEKYNDRIQKFLPVVTQTCTPPGSGNWNIASSCTLANTATVQGSVTIQSGVVLTIPSGKVLNVDTAANHITIKSGGGLLIKSGGMIK